MDLQNFIDAVNRYDGVNVVTDESGCYVEIIFNKHFDHVHDAPEIEFYRSTDSVTLWGAEGIAPDILLQISEVLKLTYKFLLTEKHKNDKTD